MLGQLLDWWMSLYANHAALRTGIEFVHIGGLLGGGGCAIAADRAILSARHDESTMRSLRLRSAREAHRLVLVGLAAVVVSGLLLFASDVDTFLYSRLFWAKMGLLVLLLANGGLMLSAERDVERAGPRAWGRLVFSAMASLVLWFLTTLAGAALPNIG
jgi:hypothetical protein